VRIVSKLLVAATTAAAVTALMAGPALADPQPPGTIPGPTDVVGVGSDTTEFVFDQLSADYNATHTTGKLYSWDALSPKGLPQHDPIQVKSGSAGCNIPRPFGSSEGITALVNTMTTGGHPCIDYARSSRPRASTDSPSISFINVAGDAVTYATQPGSNAPTNLDTADLTAIYNCSRTTWNTLPDHPGTSTAKISAFAPQNGSGTQKFFLGALGLTAPGPCVSTSATVAGAAGNAGNTLEENEGVAPILNKNKANVIFPFSVGKYIAEKFHSASCGTIAQCFATPTACTPTGGQNIFGCNTHGTMVLRSINGTAPTTGTDGQTVINPNFTPTFSRLLFAVVNSPQGTIPSNLKKYFGPTGFICTNTKAKNHLKKYGFLVLPNGGGPGQCGHAQ